jgi:hypothetical protein
MSRKKLLKFNCVNDVLEAIKQIRDELVRVGEPEAAKLFTGMLMGYFTTSSELLIELSKALEETRPVWKKLLSSDFQMLAEHTIAEAGRIFRRE